MRTLHGALRTQHGFGEAGADVPGASEVRTLHGALRTRGSSVAANLKTDRLDAIGMVTGLYEPRGLQALDRAAQ